MNWYVCSSDGSYVVVSDERAALAAANDLRAAGRHVVSIGTEPPCVSVSVELLQALADTKSSTHAVKNDAIDAVLADAFQER